MKVGTDAVLLGAYADVLQATRILDIGTGCGVIAIMLAQRSAAIIEGVEIDEASAEQAGYNVSLCPWPGRITITHASFQDHCLKHHGSFDLVISNPPFFSNSLKSPGQNRNLARHTKGYEELVRCAKQALSPSGKWWLILPFNESDKFIVNARQEGFHLHHRLDIFPKAGKKAHRNILSLGREEQAPFSTASLTIRDQDGSFTEEYKKLTCEFYLNF